MDIPFLKLSNRNLWIIYIISAFACGCAVGYGLVYGSPACNLCQLQISIFVSIMVISPIGIWFGYMEDKKTVKFIIWTLFFITAILSAVAIYQIIIQLGLVSDPCPIKILQNMEKDIFANESACSNMSSIFGIPISVLSLFLSLICFTIITQLLISKPRNE